MLSLLCHCGKKNENHERIKNWCADLADMQLVSRFDRRFHFLVCVIGIYSKYVWFVPVKDKKDDTITNSFLNGFK